MDNYKTSVLIILSFLFFGIGAFANIPPANYGGNVVRTKGGGAVSSVELDGGKIYWDGDQDSYSYSNADDSVRHVVDGGVTYQCTHNNFGLYVALSADENIYLAQSKAFVWDTDLDTWMETDNTDDQLTMYVDGGAVWKVESADMTISSTLNLNDDVYLASDKKIYFDADKDSWIGSGGLDDRLYFQLDATQPLVLTASQVQIRQLLLDPDSVMYVGSWVIPDHGLITGSTIFGVDASNNSFEVDGLSWFDEDMRVAETKKIVLDTDLDTYITASADDTFQVFTDGGAVLTMDEVNAALAIPLFMDDNKIAFDADDDTYMETSADDVWDWYVGGDQKASCTVNTINLKETIALDQDEAFFLDTDQDTYVTTDNTDDQWTIYVDGGSVAQFVDGQVNIPGSLDVDGWIYLQQGFRIVFDTDEDSYITASDDDTLGIATGDQARLYIKNSDIDFRVDAYFNSNKILMDFDRDTYIYSSAEDVLDWYVGNNQKMSMSTTAISLKETVALDQDEVFYFDTDTDTYLTTSDTDDNLEIYVSGSSVAQYTNQKSTFSGQVEVAGSSYPTSKVERQGATTTSLIGIAEFKLTTSADMSNGHGPLILFTGQDDSASGSFASIGAKRNGADNSGGLVFSTYDGGVSTVFVQIEPTGELSLKERSGNTAQSGYVNVYPKTDGKVYATDDAGNEYKLSNDTFAVVDDSSIAQGKKLITDTDLDTYIYSSADDNMLLYTGGAQKIAIGGSSVHVDVPINLAPATSETGVSIKANTENVADDGTIALPNATTLWGEVQVGDDEEWAYFGVKADGTVTLRSNSANVVNTDTDTKFCIYDSGTGATLKNRLGTAKDVRYIVHY